MADLCEMDVRGYLSREEGGYAKQQSVTEWRNETIDECIQKLMILTPLEYGLANLLDSDNAVAVCRTEGEGLKGLILLVHDAGYGVVVAETASGDHYVIARAGRDAEGNLLGDIRRWNREDGYQFFFKRADERISTSPGDIMALADGRGIEIARTYTIASGFTHIGLPSWEPLPVGYIRL